MAGLRTLTAFTAAQMGDHLFIKAGPKVVMYCSAAARCLSPLPKLLLWNQACQIPIAVTADNTTS